MGKNHASQYANFGSLLNNIHTLIEFDKGKAQKSIIELSKLMQYMLYEADKSFDAIALYR